MRGVIKGVLAEELENSLRMKKEYEKALKKLPKGCISIKKIRGHKYCYLVKNHAKKPSASKTSTLLPQVYLNQ